MKTTMSKRHPKRVHTSLKAILGLAAGAEKVGKLVGITFGPHGRTIAIDRPNGVLCTTDGYAATRELELPDPVENLGASILRRGSAEMSDAVGDGTTTTLLMTSAMIQEGKKLIVAGVAPMSLCSEIRDLESQILRHMGELPTPQVNRDILLSVAMGASKEDDVLAERVVEAVMACGEEGTTTITSWEGIGVSLEMREGLIWETGWVSGDFSKGTPERVLECALVAITPSPLQSMEDVRGILEEGGNRGLPVLIVCPLISGEALQTVLLNDSKGVVTCVVINPPSPPHQQREDFEDLAAFTGATILDPLAGCGVRDFLPEWFGTARKVTISKKKVEFIGYREHEGTRNQRIEQLRMDASLSSMAYTKDRMLERASALDGGLCQLKVGGYTEMEAKERRSRAEDALRAVQVTLKGGVLPGAGRTFQFLSHTLPDTFGGKILRAGLMAPVKTLALRGRLVAPTEGDGDPLWMGWDPVKNEKRDFLSPPVLVDPVEVLQASIRTSVSSALMILSAGAAITRSLRC